MVAARLRGAPRATAGPAAPIPIALLRGWRSSHFAGSERASQPANLVCNPRFLVLDEADRLLDPTFEAPLRSVLGALPPEGRQTLLFSATMTQALVALQRARLEGAHVFQAYSGLMTADKLRQVRRGHDRSGLWRGRAECG